MCGRYSLVRGNKIVEIVPNVTVPANLRLVGRYNIAPTQQVPVIANDAARVQLFQWGLIPSWAKDAKVGYKMINARAETIAEKPAYRQALALRRCLIPADGFYEWRTDAAGHKTPMYIQMQDEDLFAFAGLWESWRDPAGHELRTFTIITTPPNALLKSIHDRMPAIIPREGYAQWLTSGPLTAEEAAAWLKPFPAELMKARPVSPLVNSPKNEGPALIVSPAAPAENRPPPRSRKPRPPEPPGLFG